MMTWILIILRRHYQRHQHQVQLQQIQPPTHWVQIHKAGLYVLLPILLPEHIPASIVSINGSLAHITG